MALTKSGWLSAVAAEAGMQSAAIWVPLASVRRNGDGSFTLVFHPDRLRRGQDSGRSVRVDDELHGAEIEHAPRGGGPPDWHGHIHVVLVDESELVVRVEPGGRPPAPGDGVRMYPPNYLAELRDWLATANLPEQLDSTLASRCRGEAAHLDLTGPASLRKRQREALRLAGAPVAVLWGPPGTGKTYTLAQLAAAMVQRQQRVVVLAPTRVAADTATLAIDRALQNLGMPPTFGQVLRTDLPELHEQFEAAGNHLLAWAQIDAEWRALANTYARQRIQLLQQRTPATAKEVDEQLALLEQLRTTTREVYRQRQQNLVLSASVVCATVRQNQTHNYHAAANQVLVDEASMVSFSDAAHILLTGTAPTVFAGDHRQLGPIAQTAGRGKDGKLTSHTTELAKSWLGTSILDWLDMQLTRLGVPRVMLDEQSRMNAELCQVVSTTMYEGSLRPVDAPPAGIPPRLPAGICILDSDAPPRWLELATNLGNPTEPRLATPQSASAAVGLARWLAREGHSVVLAAPYRAQAGLLRRGVADLGGRVRAGTVHRLQGQEADVSIYDPTKPMSNWPGLSREAPLMLNVAASRGRRVFVLCNGRQWMEKSELLHPFLRAGHWVR